MRRVKIAMVTLALASIIGAAGAGQAAAAAQFEIPFIEGPTRVEPGQEFSYNVVLRNESEDASDGSDVQLTLVLPSGVQIDPNIETYYSVDGGSIFQQFGGCSDFTVNPVHCVLKLGDVPRRKKVNVKLEADLDADATGVQNLDATVSGGGGVNAYSTQHSIDVGSNAQFGIKSWNGAITPSDETGGKLQAGSHPKDIVTKFSFHSSPFLDPFGNQVIVPDVGSMRNLFVDTPAGFVGAPAAVPTCDLSDLHPDDYEPFPGENPGRIPNCPLDSIVGTIETTFSGINMSNPGSAPLFNMEPPPGSPAAFGFNYEEYVLQIVADARTDGDLGVTIKSLDTNQGLTPLAVRATFWGVPGDPSHDIQRCQFYDRIVFIGFGRNYCWGEPGEITRGPNPPSISPRPFLTLPTNCGESGEKMKFDLTVESWSKPMATDKKSFETAQSVTGCDRVPFQPKVEVQPTTDQAETPSGLEVALTVPPDGLLNPKGISQSHLKDATVTLPDGMSINPSYGDGVTYCTPAQVGLVSGNSETIRFNKAPATCPDAAQLADVQVDVPLLKEPLKGAAYVAQQDDPSIPGSENPFDSTLALYIVVEGSGVLAKLAGEVAPDPKTGQVVAHFLNNPQVPFERFALKFKGGQRAPLSTPPVCGSYSVKAELTPWARPDDPVTVSDSFNIRKGPHEGPCPSGQTPPFRPGLLAGMVNNTAGSHAPMNIRLTREDGEQEFTHFSFKLPPGLIGKLTGVSYCSDAALEAAKTKSGAQELASPSCPANSYVGRTEVGAGVGGLQVYTPGRIYLAGPYNGSAVSVAAITAAKVGPFDLGTVVVRQALRVNPETSEVFIDATGSDPIPHIIDGIVVHARDIRVFVDRPSFMLNPTNCTRTSIASTVLGSGLDFASAIDDNPITVTSPFQAADCAALEFEPELKLSLSGSTKRGKNPAFKAVLTAKPGEANIAKSSVVLPRSEFLDNAHIGTVCTRVQFNQGKVPGEKCPAESVYGKAQAITPLLDVPVEGPVFLRSNNGERDLPDLVAALHGPQLDVNLVGFVDSVSHKLKSGERVSNIRNIFATVPDAPVTKFTLEMFGGNKGLLENSTNLCAKPNRADVEFTGQNGKLAKYKRALTVKCKKGGKKRHKRGPAAKR